MVIDITAAQLTANGFTLEIGSGERIQLWSGAVNGDSVQYVFDSTKNKAMQIGNADPATLALFSVAVVVLDLIAISTAGAAAKAAANASITKALDRI